MKKTSALTATIALLGLVLALPAVAALQPGAQAPAFSAQASLDGKDFTFSLRKSLQKGPVVVYFFPSAFTHGCDIEAHTFATHKDKFDAAGATIIGVSADSIKRLNAFSADPDFCAGKFPVASDADGAIATSYGLELQAPHPGATDVRGKPIKHGFIPRTTFVLNSNGHIVKTLSSSSDGLTPVQHVTKSLAIVKQLQASHTD